MNFILFVKRNYWTRKQEDNEPNLTALPIKAKVAVGVTLWSIRENGRSSNTALIGTYLATLLPCNSAEYRALYRIFVAVSLGAGHNVSNIA